MAENKTENKEKKTENKVTNLNKFYKISEGQFNACGMNKKAKYEDIKLPVRATKGSAGYDFFAPFDFTVMPGMGIQIPTGIRIRLNPENVLMCFPRSSLGFKYKLKLDNTVGIIDSDYFYSDNEGHIMVSMTNMSSDRVLNIKKGDKIFQGLIMTYGITADDKTSGVRNGGFGSTDS